ncbi:MAG TPA: replication protein [Blastocatellia bacterium]|nr:replication protein [Blastocatellia bacterium]
MARKKSLSRQLAEEAERQVARSSEPINAAMAVILGRVPPSSPVIEPAKPSTSTPELDRPSPNRVPSPIKVQSPNRIQYPEKGQPPNRAQSPDGVQHPKGTVPQEGTVTSQGAVSTSGFLRTPNTVADDVAKALPPFEWAVYWRLFRLSYGWGKDTCIVGTQALIEATHISKNQIRRIISSLCQKGYIEILQIVNNRDLKGTEYRVYTVPKEGTVTTKMTAPFVGTESQRATVPKQGTNKHDHDDFKKHDPHQSEVMKIYISLTGNGWNSVIDDSAYNQVKHIPIEQIGQLMKVIHRDAANPIGSFAFFAKSIKQRLAQGKQSHGQIKKRMTEIVSVVRETHVGQHDYTMADFVEDVKRACIDRGVTYDNDVFNELMSERSA